MGERTGKQRKEGNKGRGETVSEYVSSLTPERRKASGGSPESAAFRPADAGNNLIRDRANGGGIAQSK